MIGLIPAENWEYSLFDVFAGLKSATKNRDDFSTIFIDGIGSCIPTRSARAGIYTAIKTLGLPPGARIGVPLYCCPVVFKAIEAAGCKHCFIDIDSETCCMSANDLAQKKNEFDAIVAVHMFGNTCDVQALLNIAQGRPIIEDCAQSLGSSINGHVTGTLGTVGAFSFRSGKYLTVGEGGALFTSQQSLAGKLSEAIANLPVPNAKDEIMHLVETYIRTKLRSRPFYGLVGYTIWQFYNKTIDYSSKSPIAFTQSFKSDVATAARRLKNLSGAINKQRKYSEIFISELKLTSGMYCEEVSGSFYNRYLFPIILSSTSQRDQMVAYLLKHKIGTAKPYSDIASVAAKHYGYKGDCPVSELVAARVLVMPNYHRLKEKEILSIAKCFNKGLMEIS